MRPGWKVDSRSVIERFWRDSESCWDWLRADAVLQCRSYNLACMQHPCISPLFVAYLRSRFPAVLLPTLASSSEVAGVIPWYLLSEHSFITASFHHSTLTRVARYSYVGRQTSFMTNMIVSKNRAQTNITYTWIKRESKTKIISTTLL